MVAKQHTPNPVGLSVELICVPRSGVHGVAAPFSIHIEEMEDWTVRVTTGALDGSLDGSGEQVTTYPRSEDATTFLADLIEQAAGSPARRG